MIRVLVLLLTLLAAGCRVVPNPDCPDVSVRQSIENAQQNALQNSSTFPLRGQACGPTLEPLATGDADGGACAPEAGDNPCVICGKVDCCAAAVACAEDPNCNPGTESFGGLIACLQAHCAKECLP